MLQRVSCANDLQAVNEKGNTRHYYLVNSVNETFKEVSFKFNVLHCVRPPSFQNLS